MFPLDTGELYSLKHMETNYGVVGFRYWSSYWHEEFDVLDYDRVNGMVYARTVGETRIRKHCTKLDRRDKLIGPTPSL